MKSGIDVYPPYAKKDMDPISRSLCINKYCNPSCKDTVIGEKKETAAMKNSIKTAINIITKHIRRKGGKKAANNARKELTGLAQSSFRLDRKFATRKFKQPLKDGFYKGLPSDDVEKIKARGATSVCDRYIPIKLLKRTRKTKKTAK